MQRKLDIPFKGSRTYLHSTNSWDAVASLLSADELELGAELGAPDTVLDITFRSLILEGVDLLVSGTRLKTPEAKAQMLIKSAGGARGFGELVSNGMPVTERVDDAEGPLRAGAVIDADGATFTGPLPVSLSQVYVALIKFWHQTNVDNDCKWLATRLQLPLACLTAEPATVRVVPETILKDGAGSVTRVSGDDDDTLSGRIWFFKA